MSTAVISRYAIGRGLKYKGRCRGEWSPACTYVKHGSAFNASMYTRKYRVTGSRIQSSSCQFRNLLQHSAHPTDRPRRIDLDNLIVRFLLNIVIHRLRSILIDGDSFFKFSCRILHARNRYAGILGIFSPFP